MIHIQKIRKLIYNLLNYYELKESNHKKKSYYYLYKSKLFQSEFECLSTENRIGLDTNFSDKKAIICLNLLKMLYDRDYEYLINIYNYMINNDIFDEYIEFKDTLDNPQLWTKILSMYYNKNEININKYDRIPRPLKNFKAKVKQKFYNIEEIKNYFYI